MLLSKLTKVLIVLRFITFEANNEALAEFL